MHCRCHDKNAELLSFKKELNQFTQTQLSDFKEQFTIDIYSSKEFD